ncbi:MAG: Ig-like domain-containing protein [Methanobrevibacter sp.]|nr:Ig-like domain-containing protein [Methanobrevibacter sp.]
MIMKNINKSHLFLFTITFILLITISLQASFAESTTITEEMQSGIAGGLSNSNIDEIILEKGTYRGTNNTGILINNSVTIRGNETAENVIINAENSRGIFTINRDMLNITFINLTFTNGNAVKGGAVNNAYLNSNLTFINCKFTNNRAIDYAQNRGAFGGAIYNVGHNLYIENCTFTDNQALSSPSVGSWCEGGAIYNSGNNVFIINSNFTKNFSNGTMNCGGAIMNFGHNINIIHCEFNENKARAGGGAIHSRRGYNFTIKDSTFTNNEASTAGAIFFYEGYNITIINSTFTDNNASFTGAIYFQTTPDSICGKITIENSTFTNNKAETAGAIQFMECVDFIVKNTNFAGNNAYFSEDSDGNGGALYIAWGRDYSVIDSNFTDNSAYNNGSAIYIVGYLNNDFLIENSNFINNKASYGGAIYNRNTNYITIMNSKFENNQANYGGAIYNYGYIERNSIWSEDGETDEFKQYPLGSNFTVKNTNFINNTAENGGAIYNYQGDNFTVIDSNFTNNKAYQNGGAIYNHGSVYEKEGWITYNSVGWVWVDGDLTYTTSALGFAVKNANFINNTAENNGGAIYNNNADNFKVTESDFTNNTAENGGAIYNNANLAEVWGRYDYLYEFWDNFWDNLYKEYDEYFWEESWNSIWNSFLFANNFTVTNTNFTNNTAYQNGGAIYNEGGDGFNVRDSQFILNTAENNGGAIYNQIDVYLDEDYWNQFWEEYWIDYFYNKFMEDDWWTNWYDAYWTPYWAQYWEEKGGKDWSYKEYSSHWANQYYSEYFSYKKGLVGSFVDDFLKDFLPGFYTKNIKGNDFTVTSSNFTNNTAINGSAIFNNFCDNFDVTDSKFANNTAIESGTIYNLGNMSVSRNTMEDNKANFGQMIFNLGNMGILNLTYIENKTVNITTNTTIDINATLTDDMSNTITGQSIAFIIGGGEPIYVTSEEGKASVSYTTPNKGGLIPITGDYSGRDGYEINRFNGALIIPVTAKIDTSITITTPENVKIPALSNEGSPVNITGILRDEKGNSIANKNITVTIDGNTSTVETDGNGGWSVPYIPTKNGTIVVVAKFAGDEDYNPCENTSTFTVTKGKIFIKITVTENPDGSITITANVTDDEGNPVGNYPVDFYMDGKNIGHKYTDNNGIASITISGDGKKHEFEVLVPDAEIDESSENKITHSPRATERGEENNTHETDDDNSKDDNPSYEDNSSDKDKTPSTSGASMKNTGTPIIVLLIVLLSSLGITIRKKII